MIGLLAFERIVQADPAARRVAVTALRQLRERYEDVDLFCSHDPGELDALRAQR